MHSIAKFIVLFWLVVSQFTRQNVNFSMLKVFSKNIYIVNRNIFIFFRWICHRVSYLARPSAWWWRFLISDAFFGMNRIIFWKFSFLRKKNLYVPSLQELLKLSLMMKKLPLTAYGWSRLVSSIKWWILVAKYVPET